MSNLTEYIRLISSWRIKYNVPDVPSFDPTTSSMCCTRCQRIRQKMARHHKGNDLFFARLMPDSFARRYVMFHPEDVAKLCNRCHSGIHRYMKPAYAKMLADLNRFYKLETQEAREHWCNTWRAEFVKLFDEWMAKYRPRSATKREVQSGKRRKRRRKRVRKNRTQSRSRKD